jgi:hypothetical protein
MVYDFTRIPPGAALRGVTAEPALVAGRTALRVELTEMVKAGTFGTDYADEPTFVLLDDRFVDGTIDVDVLARLAPDAPDYARGFIGLAYRVRPAGSAGEVAYESVYVRPLNGRGLDPPAPRDVRAVQYYAYPDWKFDRLREERPDGGWEVGADIAPGAWVHLRVEVNRDSLLVTVGAADVLRIERTLGEVVDGQIGLWVDIGTEGYFADLEIAAREE